MATQFFTLQVRRAGAHLVLSLSTSASGRGAMARSADGLSGHLREYLISSWTYAVKGSSLTIAIPSHRSLMPARRISARGGKIDAL